MKTDVIPTQWGTSKIILIYKNGDRADIINYRLNRPTFKPVKAIHENLKEKRISEISDFQQTMEQAGFRKNFTTIDHYVAFHR